MKPTGSSYILINPTERRLEMQLSFRHFKEGRWYFAECPELKLIDQGKTLKSAYNNLRQMVIASLIEAIESDNVDMMLRALGFKRSALTEPALNVYNVSGEKYKNLIPLDIRTTVSPKVLEGERETAAV